MAVAHNDPFLCARCHQGGLGCCRASSQGPEIIFGLSWGEVQAMAQASGLEPDQFVVSDRATPGFLASLEPLHPVYAGVMPGGRRQRLKIMDDGACFFLEPGGCSLPRAARPIFCRMFPFAVDSQGELTLLINHECLAQAGGLELPSVMARLGVGADRLMALHQRHLELAGW